MAVAMEQMKDHPVPQPKRPPYPNYQRPAGAAATTSTSATENHAR